MRCGEGVCKEVQEVFKAFCRFKKHKTAENLKSLWKELSAFNESGIKCQEGNKVIQLIEPKIVALIKLGDAVPFLKMVGIVAMLDIQLEELKKCCKG